MTILSFDPRTIDIGERIEYPDDPLAEDARAWDDAARMLRGRSMCMRDDGDHHPGRIPVRPSN